MNNGVSIFRLYIISSRIIYYSHKCNNLIFYNKTNLTFEVFYPFKNNSLDNSGGCFHSKRNSHLPIYSFIQFINLIKIFDHISGLYYQYLFPRSTATNIFESCNSYNKKSSFGILFSKPYFLYIDKYIFSFISQYCYIFKTEYDTYS